MTKQIDGPSGTTFEPDQYSQPDCAECQGAEPPEYCPEPVPECDPCTIATSGAYSVVRSVDCAETRFFLVWTDADGTRQRTGPMDRMTALKSLSALTLKQASPWKQWRQDARNQGDTRFVR